jgi:hypothetical protein
VAAAVVAVALHVALDTRHYNYPKIVLYAAGLALAWAYVDKPGRARLAAMGALIGTGFLFRHDTCVSRRASLRPSPRAPMSMGSMRAVAASGRWPSSSCRFQFWRWRRIEYRSAQYGATRRMFPGCR